MIFLYRFFCGILEIELSGIYPEKIFSFLAQNRINVWNSRFENQKIRLYITVKDFKRLPKILKKSGIRVHILRKKGFPFFIKKYRKRFGIFMGIILFFAILQFMSGYIWIIDVTGNKTVTDGEILNSCESLGIKVGTKKSQIDTKNTVQDLLLKTDKLSWGSFNIEGCRLSVNVTEITPKGEDNSIATNLKAKSDGVITKIDVTSGNCVVKVGDTVKKGDILVSGIIENANDTKFVHSIGSVEARIEENITFEEEIIKNVKYPTGKVKTKKVLEIFNLKIPLYLGKTKGEFETVKDKETLKLFSQKLPIILHTKEFTFINEKIEKQTVKEISETLEKRLLKSESENGFTIKNKEILVKDNNVILNALITKTEDITYSENLIFTIGN